MTQLTSIWPLLSTFKQTVQGIYGDRLVKVLLYGSYARGEQHEESAFKDRLTADYDFESSFTDEQLKKFASC